MPKYPDALLDWSGNRAGGVKKLFYEGSGRPSGLFVTTPLLSRLEAWTNAIADGIESTPRAVLLVGGPGNGKTEAIEFTVSKLDSAMGSGGHLVQDFTRQFLPSPPRLATVERSDFPTRSGVRRISIVQDASSAGTGATTSPAALLVEDIRSLLKGDRSRVYLACVNRGVLDDALILATEASESGAAALLKKIIQAASLSAESPRCWPLQDFPDFGIWPMDVETLVENAAGESAASQILSTATDPSEWPQPGSCAAGELCPFCTSRMLLSKEQGRESFLRMLRHYELASGKRWNFRDLFSLAAHLLAGESDEVSRTTSGPCGWAAATLAQKGSRPEVQRRRALLQLLSRQYPHSLFSGWPVERARQLQADMSDLKLKEDPSLAALHLFLSRDHRVESTSTLRSQLSGLSGHLDPAFASPSFVVPLSQNKKDVRYEELDRRFSLSIRDGREFLSRHKCLTPLESAVLRDLEEADEKLSHEDVRRARPATAERVQALLRLLACRIARRAVGARTGVTREFETLSAYHLVARGDLPTLQKATHQVEELLNGVDRQFVVSLNTTFGEPLPPPERRALLTTDVQRVKTLPGADPEGRPELPLRFLKVGASGVARPVALTYDLFKATQMLQEGMVPASLPRSVVALLDTTRARLAGAIVRNDEDLDNAEISIGVRDDRIVRSFGRFVVK